MKSRRDHQRPALAQKIEHALRSANERFAADWIASLETTRGLDKDSSVLRTPTHAFDVVMAVNLHVWPARFRFALARGSVDVGSRGDPASDFDGPAFHRAADSLDRARTERKPLAIDIRGGDKSIVHLAEATAQLHHAIVADWTPRACEVVRLARKSTEHSQGLTQQDIAAKLGITQPAVSKMLTQAHHAELLASEAQLRDALEYLGGTDA